MLFLFISAEVQSNSTRLPLNQFQCMPELELETMFEMERDFSESTSSLRKEERSNSQPLLQPPTVCNRRTLKHLNINSARQRQLERKSEQSADHNAKTLRNGGHCDVVVTLESAPEETNQGSGCDREQVVVVLEDDESLYNKDFTEYQETAL